MKTFPWFHGLDIGPNSVEIFAAALASARTILWNGPMASLRIRALATHRGRGTRHRQFFGGQRGRRGDSVAALGLYGLESDVSFVSTAGEPPSSWWNWAICRTARAARKCLVEVDGQRQASPGVGNWKMNLDFVEGCTSQQLGLLMKIDRSNTPTWSSPRFCRPAHD